MKPRWLLAGFAIGAFLAPVAGRASRRMADSDRLIVNVPAEADAVALFSGWRNGTCDKFVPVAHLDQLGDASHDGTPDCPASLVVFARNYSPTVLVDPQWDATPTGHVVTVSPAPATEIGVVSWVITDAAQAPASFAAAALGQANATLEEERTGVVLIDAGMHVLPRIGGEIAKVVGQGCGRVNDIRNNSDAYVPGHLNVYYVSSITITSDAPGVEEPAPTRIGQNCGGHGAPDIIYINYQSAGPGTLLHEVGHALGSWEPTNGHTSLGGNVMQSGWKSEGGRITLGQAYRMHFSTWSWLNRREVSAIRPFVVTCQARPLTDWANWPCPELSSQAPP